MALPFRLAPKGVAAALVLVGLLLATAAGASGAKQPLAASEQGISLLNTISVSKSASGRLAQTSSELLGQTGSNLVNVMIKYDVDPTASYTGGVDGLAATSPSVTGKSLTANRLAVGAYEAYANQRIQTLNSSVRDAVPSADIGYWFERVYGGVAARVPANSIATLLSIPGVAAVQTDTLNQPLDDNTEFLGATSVWPRLGGSPTAGSNVVVGVIDTGIWPEHPMLSAAGISAPAGGLKGCQFGNGSDVAHLGPTFACNNKLIGAYAKTATYMASNTTDGQEFCNDTTHVCSPRDSEGHGTHTTTTAAGDCVSSAPLYGVERGPVCGIAPGAHVEMFRVCLAHGCYGSDSVAAVQQAITDGVNVINFSISGGAQPYSDPVELAFLDATNAGISVNASAGNSGPGAATAEHGGPWVTTVGASSGPRNFGSTLHLTADGGATLDVQGVTLTNGISSETPVVLANTLPKAGGGTEDAACQSDLAPGAATGTVVICARGTNGRADKGRRVLQGGAAGMILYNQSAAVTDLESDNHYLPAIQTQFNSNAIANFVSSHTNVMATWDQGTAGPGQADVMASFSSRGPEGDWIKPDVTAPGVQVLAGTTPQPDQTTADNGPAGNLYMAIAGTSMASPHSAGVSALVKAVHPDWTPEEIKSALMTSSTQAVVKEDGVTPADPFDMGAGRIQADRAIHPTLVFNETYAHFVAAGTDQLHRVNLNIPSIDATTFSGDVVTHRTALNVTNVNQKLKVQITQPAGVKITVGTANHPFTIDKHKSLTFAIKIHAPDVANGQYVARINLVPANGGTVVTIPVAFVKKQGDVTLSQTCAVPLSFARPGHTHCTVTAQNLGNADANAHLTVTPREDGRPLIYKNIGAPGQTIINGFGVEWGLKWSGLLTGASAPAVNSIDDITGNGPDGGYLSTALLGISPIAGVGDDTISNFNVPTFYYGGEPYTRIGVVSNGYVVVGGGDSGDIVFSPQHFPNAARPNNTIAPLWTDLNPSAGGAIRISVLSADANNGWIVVDWDGVKNFGNATTHSFEIWIKIQKGASVGPASEGITFSYGPNPTFPGDGPGLGNAGSGDPDSGQNWGAENRDGTSGINIPSAPANGSEYEVVMGDPVPGGSVTIPFDIFGGEVGTWHSDAKLTSDRTPGTTIVPRTITITG
ncbi:MAG: hypothetical protein QOG85_1883 [Gaiellaceae bacterium]|jgi:hypothetical protein|nr:hypothetical protein [Gaiellaceae bacterium]